MKQVVRVLMGLCVVLSLTGGPLRAASWSPDFYALSCDGKLYNNSVAAMDFSGFGAGNPTSVTVSTVPAYRDQDYAFVTQGPLLHVIQWGSGTPLATVNLAVETGGALLFAQDAEAAFPLEFTPETNTYPLYVVGLTIDGGVTKGYYVVLDQRAILDSSSSLPLILDQGQLCDGACSTAAARVSIEYEGDPADEQVAVVAALDPGAQSGEFAQSFYGLRPGATSGGPWTVTRSWVDSTAGVQATFPWYGIDGNWDDGTKWGAWANGESAVDVDFGFPSCPLGDAPTDVAVWSIHDETYVPTGSLPLDHTAFHFAITQGDELIGYPQGECPVSGNPPSLSESLGSNPKAIVMMQTSSESLFLITTDSGVERVRVTIENTGSGDEVELIDHEVLTNVSCPTDITLLGALSGSCTLLEDGGLWCPSIDPTGSADPPECLNENDPTCKQDAGDDDDVVELSLR